MACAAVVEKAEYEHCDKRAGNVRSDIVVK
jgi:hypothetical protein